jgi:hypothetical protein
MTPGTTVLSRPLLHCCWKGAATGSGISGRRRGYTPKIRHQMPLGDSAVAAGESQSKTGRVWRASRKPLYGLPRASHLRVWNIGRASKLRHWAGCHLSPPAPSIPSVLESPACAVVRARGFSFGRLLLWAACRTTRGRSSLSAWVGLPLYDGAMAAVEKTAGGFHK